MSNDYAMYPDEIERAEAAPRLKLKTYEELEAELAEFKQTARRLMTDTHNKWAIDRLIILAGERE